MNRVERMTGILLLLREGGRGRKRTSEEIATRFEVSKRTILRDIQALCEMGVPITAYEGAGGGYELPPDYALTPLPLSTNEALLMTLALSGLEKMGDVPFAPELASLRAKLRTLLSAGQRDQVEERLRAVALDVPERRFETPFVEALIEAAQEGRWVRAGYRSMEQESEKALLPLRVAAQGGFWYCRAYALEHGDERTYRVDRFLSVEPMPAPADAPLVPPAVPYADPSHPEVCIQLTDAGAAIAEREPHLGDSVMRTPEGAMWRFRCPPSEYEWLARYLLGMGANARVLAPPALRDRLRDAARAILALHDD